ncbi:MAG: hypothetical protein JXN64_09485 [Spirochaetes bacterium]|nr:hypothetical protein [Spirochaetota bacterium]
MKYIINTSFFKIFIILGFFSVFSLIFSCKTAVIKDPVIEQYKNYLEQDAESEEVFRVLILSDRYVISQMKFHDRLIKIEDNEGDKGISDKLKEYDKIDEACEGVLTVSLYKTGNIMQIRPKVITPIDEVNNLIVHDLKRWNFKFENDNTEPSTFDIRYKVILRKMQSDEDIMREIMERAKEEEKKGGRSDD